MKLFEIIDFYDLYDKPEQLTGYKTAYDTVPELAWDKFFTRKVTSGHLGKMSKRTLYNLKKREHLWAQDPKIAYLYALYVLNGRFPAGEDAIATSADISFRYASEIIQGKFPKGEPILLTDPECAYLYAKFVLKQRWPEAEPTIKQIPGYWERYLNFVSGSKT